MYLITWPFSPGAYTLKKVSVMYTDSDTKIFSLSYMSEELETTWVAIFIEMNNKAFVHGTELDSSNEVIN